MLNIATFFTNMCTVKINKTLKFHTVQYSIFRKYRPQLQLTNFPKIPSHQLQLTNLPKIPSPATIDEITKIPSPAKIDELSENTVSSAAIDELSENTVSSATIDEPSENTVPNYN